jgi:hypothetical protein
MKGPGDGVIDPALTTALLRGRHDGSAAEAAECYARAQEARERADSTQNLEMRAIYWTPNSDG